MRAVGDVGVSDTVPTFAGSTSTFIVWRTPPPDAVIVAVPALAATTSPVGPTRATVGAELFQVTMSTRVSPALDRTRARSEYDWPASSFTDCGSIAIEAAGPGSTATVSFVITGFSPPTTAVTTSGIVPTEPPETSPLSLTLPSNCAAVCWNLITAPGTARPVASTASARSCSESPATTRGEAGITFTRATDCAARTEGRNRQAIARRMFAVGWRGPGDSSNIGVGARSVTL